jgi:hypothetical protein
MTLKRTAALTAALWAASAVLTLSWAPPVAAGDQPCNGTNPQTCPAGAFRPGTKVGPIDLSGPVGQSVASKPPTCHNPNTPDVEVPIQVKDWGTGPDWPVPEGEFDPGPPPFPGAHYYVHWCPGLNQDTNFNNWLPGTGWDNPTPEPLPPTPAQVRDAIWAEVQGLLHNPALTLDPNQAIHSVLNVPTFVAINNPQLSTLYEATVQGVYVWLAVVPTTTLHPGEPGSPTVPCDEDGSAFVEGAGTADDQAADANGCVYTYTQRSAGWPGNVTITWAVSWGSNQQGQFGTLGAAPNVGGFNRIVDEVQTVVGDGDTAQDEN